VKCYSEEWWNDLYSKMVCRFGEEYNIVEVLPVENISQIAFKAPAYYSKDIREIGAVIANTSVFVGADSGIMHLASASGTPTLGLFSATKTNQYEPYNMGSLAIDTNKMNANDIVDIIEKTLSY